MDYIDYIDENIKRLHQIQLYNASLIDAKKDHQKEYYKKSIELLLDPGETLDNWAQVASEYKTARAIRSEELNKLRAELKKIKKFK